MLPETTNPKFYSRDYRRLLRRWRGSSLGSDARAVQDVLYSVRVQNIECERVLFMWQRRLH